MKKTIFKKITSFCLIAAFIVVSMTVPISTVSATETSSITSTTDYKVNKIYSGFKLLSSKAVADINSTIMMFSHIKTGARLIFVKNNDNERSFSISFRTPAKDDTGVNHIIEHSVLNGSKNYPVKSPFAEMLKRSLGTFINAFTSNDYTMYPVSSMNEKDLQNLMGVYLDAVFYPNFYNDQNIFKQEAWRYNLESKNSKLTTNGIIYNEMKGNYSNPTYLLEREVSKSLFPDSSYKWDAGGNPDAITTLTWEKFKAVHKKYYSPSNSYIFLYGNLDIGKYLEFIDKNYLSKFSKTNTDTSLRVQKAFSKPVEKVSYYPVSEDSDINRKTYLSLNYVTGKITDKDLMVGMDYLSYLLVGSDNSPLRKALFESGIADNFYSNFKEDSLQPVFSICAENSDASSKEEFKRIVNDVLKKTAKRGFDKELLKSTFTQYDFNKRIEKLSPMKGLTFSMNVMKSWLYDKDPTLYVDKTDSVQKIKMLADKKYFENLINKYLLSNKHSSLVILKPSAGLERKDEQTRLKKLEGYQKKLDTRTVSSLVDSTKSFKVWQDKPDSAEGLAKIPRLSVKDIKPELPDLNVNFEKQDGVGILSHNVSLDGISNINMYFDISKVPQEKLYYMNLLSTLLGNIDTKNYSLNDLKNELFLYSNGISFSANANVSSVNPDEYKPVMTASLLTLNDNIDKSLGLLEEIINNTIFENKAKIKQIIQQNKLYMQQMYSSGGGMYSSLKMSAYLSEGGRYQEELLGPGYYRFLNDIDKNYDKNWDEISKNLKETYSLIFNKNGLIASHSGDINGLTIFKTELQKIIPKLKSDKLPEQKYKLATPERNMALPLPVKVQTIIKGGSFAKEGYEFSGKMLVLQRILNMEYLYKNIRTSGGAYGFNVSFSKDGTMALMSMRDPNLSETLNTFNGAVKFLREFKATEDEMENFIIGTISEFQKIKSMGPLYEGSVCDSLYLSGLSSDELLKWMEEALSTKAEDIANYADMVERVLNQNLYYVEGSQEKLEENKDLFTKLDTF